MKGPLAKFITFCGYSGSAKDLIVNLVHPLFLKAKQLQARFDDLTWWEAMCGFFADEYWKATTHEVKTLEVMNAWKVVDITENINVLQST